MLRRYFIFPFLCCVIGINCLCNKEGSGSSTTASGGNNNGSGVVGPSAELWFTASNGSVLLQRQSPISFGTIANNNPYIDVDTINIMQTIDGFGYTLTGGSASVINTLDATTKNNLLQELFGNNSTSIVPNFVSIRT